MLRSIDEFIDLTLFGASIKLSTSLPFSWQLFFIAACLFSVANIIYSISCPLIVKSYSNFTEFESQGKTRAQINQAIKALVWSDKKGGIKPEYVEKMSSYLKFYQDGRERDEPQLDCNMIELLNDLTDIKGKNSNAFYYVYNISDVHNPKVITLTFGCYIVGLILFGVIAIQNIYYVVGTMG
ncbi:MAG: hypothetical protein HRT88_09670 [Lentisphaeraceae bacterium]|nr:hypothetical protein [Lentisphaeraceae bacterium]